MTPLTIAEEIRAKADAKREYDAWEREYYGRSQSVNRPPKPGKNGKTPRMADAARRARKERPLCSCGRPVGRNGTYCRACYRREYSHKYYAQNVDAVKQRAAKWRKENKERRNEWERKRYHAQQSHVEMA